MRRQILALFLLASTPIPVLAQKEFGFDNRKPSGQPYLKPAESLAKMHVPPEFDIGLFAAEPDVVNPIAFTIDERGRVWVIESFDYPKRAGKNVPRDRIVILEDTDGDGKCDKRSVFAEGKDFPVLPERQKAGLGAFDLASGIEVGYGGVFVGAPPYLWFIENKNDKPGKFEAVLGGFGSQDTHETLNTFQWGPDGWLYGLHGVFTTSNVKATQLDGPAQRVTAAVWRYNPTRKKFEQYAEGTSNPWGMDYRNTDGQWIVACCVIPHLFHIVPGGIYKRQAGTSSNPYAYGEIPEICDHTFHRESGWAHAGLISLDVPHIPEKYRDSVIFGSIHGCSLKRNVLKPKGSTYVASRADDFLKSDDKNFRPINMKWGPNGDIYLSDWHDQNPCHQAADDAWDYERGRIYRISVKGMKREKVPDLSRAKLPELVDTCVSPRSPWEQRVALHLVSEHAWRNQFDESKKGMTESEFHTWRMFGFDDLLQKSPKSFNIDLLGCAARSSLSRRDADPLRVSFSLRSEESLFPILPGDLKLADHPSAIVRRECAAALIRFPYHKNLVPRPYVLEICQVLMTHKEDATDPVIPLLLWVAYEKALFHSDCEAKWDESLLWLSSQSSDNPFVRDQIAPRVLRRLVATNRPADLDRCIGYLARIKDNTSRDRAMKGLIVALAGRTVAPPKGWPDLQREIQGSGEPGLIGLSNKLAVSFRDPAAISRALAAAKNTTLPVEARCEAARELAVLKPAEAVAVLLALVRSNEPAALRAESARGLAAFDSKTLAAELLAGWKDYPKPVQNEVVNTLAGRKEWARALLQAMAEGKVERAAVTDNTIIRIEGFQDKELTALIARAWGRARATPKELGALIDKTRASLHEAPASFARGRAVFETNCAKCHKFEGKGAEVGPALDGAARDIDYILVNVLDPNRVIGAPYFLRLARLLDGTLQQGVLAAEDDTSITLKVENGVLKKIARADLDGPVQVLEKSLMPEGLGYNMSPQDFRDLVRYLMANPFLTDVAVNGKKASVGVPGRVGLPDTKGTPAVIESEVSAPDDLRTSLLIGSSGDFEISLDGKEIGKGRGTGNSAQPDQTAIEVRLPKGDHKLTISVKATEPGGVVFARFLDPDRKLRYPDPGEKK